MWAQTSFQAFQKFVSAKKFWPLKVIEDNLIIQIGLLINLQLTETLVGFVGDTQPLQPAMNKLIIFMCNKEQNKSSKVNLGSITRSSNHSYQNLILALA